MGGKGKFNLPNGEDNIYFPSHYTTAQHFLSWIWESELKTCVRTLLVMHEGYKESC